MNEMTVGINGIAGRIGKFTAYEIAMLGVAVEKPQSRDARGIPTRISAVNDLASTDEIIASLQQKDAVHGALSWEISKIAEDDILINGNPVKVFHEENPAKIFWPTQIVADCTGRCTSTEQASQHFQHSAFLEYVAVSAPGDMPMYCMGINHAFYQQERIVSNASCTTKAVALPLKVLLDAGIGIEAVLLDTTHAATNTQKPLQVFSAYGVLDTIMSAKTGAAKSVGKLLPELENKIDGFAMRVPTRDGSFANIYLVVHDSFESAEDYNQLFRGACNNTKYAGRLSVFEGDEIGSPDIIGNTTSATIALSKTKLIPFPNHSLLGIVSGYDNERGPAKDLALLCQYMLKH